MGKDNMADEKACGVIIFKNENDTRKYVVICGVGNYQGYYGFPKGHMEAGETERETAIREVKEETGLDVVLFDDFRTVDEHPLAREGRPNDRKTNVYFLAEYHGQEFVMQKTEVSEIVLMGYDEAMKCLQYEESRRELTEAEEYLRERDSETIDKSMDEFRKDRHMTHQMQLQPEPFDMIKSGEKTIELRLYDEKRRKIRIGDEIVFTNTENGETLTARVLDLAVFDSFEDLYKTLPLLRCGYTEQDIASASPDDMDVYYPKEKQKEYGVVGITIALKSAEFLSYYRLKEELVQFCRKNGLPTSGGKQELTDRIACFLDTGAIMQVNRKRTAKQKVSGITKNSIIESGFVCSELHRAFFKREIGDGFSFNVAFQKWLKENAGKTYTDAIAAYNQGEKGSEC